MQQRNINKDCRVSFGGIFIVPFLGPALGYLTAQCAAWGWEIWLHLTGMICPWAENLTANVWKMSNPHPMPCLPPRRFYIDRCITFANRRWYLCSGPLTDSKNDQSIRFEFSFNLTGKSTMTFLTGQSWRVLKSWYTGERPEQGFRRCFALRRIKLKFSFVCDAG